MADKLIPTPSQTVGPFFHLGMARAEWGDLTAHSPPGALGGERITIEGRVIDGDGAPAARVHREARVRQEVHGRRARPVDADHVGAHVTEHHGSHRPRADPGELEDLQSCKRSHAGSP